MYWCSPQIVLKLSLELDECKGPAADGMRGDDQLHVPVVGQVQVRVVPLRRWSHR